MPFRVTSLSLFNEKVAEATRANQYVLILWMGPHCHVCTQHAVPAFAEAEASGNYRNVMFLQMEWTVFFHTRNPLGPICLFQSLPRCVLCKGEKVTGVPEFHLFRTSTRHLEQCHAARIERQFPQKTLQKMCCFDFLDGWDETKFSNMLSRTLQPPNPLSIGITLCDGPAGVTIETVAVHGPAGLSGQVFPGDFVISFGGFPCNGPATKKWRFMQLMNEACSAGSELELVLMRGDTSPLNVRLTPVRIDSFDKTPWFLQCERHESTVFSQREERFRVGVQLVDKDGRAGPVVGSVDPGGPADLSGQVFPDDLILSWNGIPCKGLTLAELERFRSKSEGILYDDVKLELQRDGARHPIIVSLTPEFYARPVNCRVPGVTALA